MLEQHLEIPADRIFKWFKDEMASKRQRVTYRATREYVADDDGATKLETAGEEASIRSVSTIANLEITPTATEDGWLLKVYVQDVVGPHVPEDHSVSDEPEEIGLDDFYRDYIAPDEGTIFVSVKTESEAARAQFESLLTEMTEDRDVA